MIELPKGFAVSADDHCFIVGKLKQRTDGRIEITNPKYYTTMHQAIRGTLCCMMRASVKDGDITTLQQFSQEQRKLHGELWRLISPLSVSTAQQSRAEGHNPTKTT